MAIKLTTLTDAEVAAGAAASTLGASPRSPPYRSRRPQFLGNAPPDVRQEILARVEELQAALKPANKL